MMAATGVLLVLLGLVGGGFCYLRARARRTQQGGPGPIPERAIHAVAGVKMLIGGTVAIFLGVVAILSSLSG